jgi:hypothetical protein
MRLGNLRISPALVAVCTSLATSLSAQAQSPQTSGSNQGRIAGAFSWFAESDARYVSWQGTRGTNVWAPEPGKGSQFYTPLTLGMDYRQPELYKFETRVKGGWTETNSKTVGQESTVATWLDTQVTTTWTYLGSQNFRTFVGLATNLPTGKSYFPNNERFVRMDPDLVEVSVAGAGFNFNPTAGFIFAVNENTAVSLSAGYAWLGEFTREGFDGGSVANCFVNICLSPPTAIFDKAVRINPGDVFTANANVSSVFANYSVKSSFAYMSSTKVTEDGRAVGQKGATFSANSTVTFKISDPFSLVLNGTWGFAEKNKYVDPATGMLYTELKNSNSNLLIGKAEPVFKLTDKLSVSGNYTILWRSANYYDIVEGQYIPEKLKQSVGGSMTLLNAAKSSITLRGSYFWINENQGAYLPSNYDQINSSSPKIYYNYQNQPPDLRYTGWTLAVSGKVSF